MKVLKVGTFFDEKSRDFKLELIAGADGLDRLVTVPDVNRPGLAFTGFFEHLPYERAQIIGIAEFTFLKTLSHEQQISILKKVFSPKQVPCCIITRGFDALPSMIEVFTELKVPLLKTSLTSSQLLSDLIYYFDEKLALSEKLHGVLSNVYGLGVFIRGKSGIGKSECALELVKRGHMLVSDDIVEITKRSGHILVGKSAGISKHHMEIRGIGIIDIQRMFGIANILDESKIELVINLIEWDEAKKHERLGIDEHYTDILGVSVPELTIPVGAGRNLAIIVETASLNQRLKNRGHFSALELSKKLMAQLNKSKNEK
ncbi:MAG: HPr(Ser) kinase/phosphatase [Endomicrobiaceae bacterium]|nr:HPr(Ser) kinase/phosphatase [Endomicrobiaceae bacterium]